MTKRRLKNYIFHVIVLAVISPLWALTYEGFSNTSDTFGFLIKTALDDVLLNSFVIVFFTSLGVLTIGTGTAWFITQYSFWGRSVLQWALFMPLAFPAYILAYLYTDFFDEAGQLALALKSSNLSGFLPDFRTIWGASFILTFCLYPYVYLFARNGFLAGSKTQIESAVLLGANVWSQFFTIALPAARPFLIVGLMLVIMEVLADYGTMDYFGIRVFSTMIYDSWAGYGDITAAARLSIVLLLFVIGLVFLEKNQRGKMKFHTRDNIQKSLSTRKQGSILMSCLCSIPVFIGFIIPMIIMLNMVIDTFETEKILKTLPYLGNTLLSSLLVALLGIVIAFVLTLQKRQISDNLRHILFHICGFGYALPGIILGLGFLLISSLFSALNILITGTFVFLIVGYLIRFLNVALQGIEAGYEKMSPSISEASQLMQRHTFDDVWHVKLPLLWPSMLTAGLILAVEVIKELPLTLLLRPFDFDTLAVLTHNLASDERLADASFPSLCIVLAGCIPVFLMNKLSRSPS